MTPEKISAEIISIFKLHAFAWDLTDRTNLKSLAKLKKDIIAVIEAHSAELWAENEKLKAQVAVMDEVVEAAKVQTEFYANTSNRYMLEFLYKAVKKLNELEGN
jgi:hypothetical protein